MTPSRSHATTAPARAGGPLLYLGARHGARARRVGDRSARPGQPPRRGQVIDAGDEVTVDPGARGHARACRRRALEVTLTGDAALGASSGASCWAARFDGIGRAARRRCRAPVGEALAPDLGRADQPGAPRAAGRLHRDRHLGDRRHEHAGARPEAARLLGPGPARRSSSRRRSSSTRARRAASRSPSSSSAIGITARETRRFLDRFEASGALRAQRAVPERGPRSDRSSGCSRRASRSPQAEYLAFDARHARARGDGRHDALLRGAARDRRPRARRSPAAAATPATCTPTSRRIYERAGDPARPRRLGDAAPDPHDARRRHHASDPRPHRLHHRGADRAVARAAPARRVPADRRAAVALAADERRHRRRADRARAPPLGRPALRRLRARPRGAA